MLSGEKRLAELRPKLDEAGQRRFAIVEWLPPSMNDAPPYSINRFAEEAAKEAVKWGSLFELAEPRVQALRKATAALRFDRTCDGYGAALDRWQEAFDALAPFVEEPPAAFVATPEKQPGRSSGGGGRPPNDEALARDLLAGWKAFEPEDGRKTKERYLAQRPDVRVLKTEEARQRKIASLRVALDSALHLRREKTKQRRQARG
jgi:hypothetical protein